MYKESTKSDAFLYYCQGLSFEKIAEIISAKPGCQKIAHSTISKWSKTPDIAGKTWADRKQEYMLEVQRHEGKTVVAQRKSLLECTEDLIDTLLTDIEGGSLKHKSKTAAMYAFTNLARFRNQLKEKEQRVAIADQVQLLLEAFSEDEVIGPLLAERWDMIYKSFADKVEKMAMSKRHGE